MSIQDGVKSSGRTLVVEPDDLDRIFLVDTLVSVGLHVTATESFSSARELLVAHPPSILITEIRLDDYNGLQLAHLGRSLWQHMSIVVISRFRDRVLQREAEDMGAAFIHKPMTMQVLLATLRLTCSRTELHGIREPF